MAYTKTNWSDGTTPLDATNMNKIEDGIATNADDISSLNDDLTNKADYAYYDSLDDFVAGVGALPAYGMDVVCMGTNLVSTITNGALSANGIGVAMRGSARTTIDFFVSARMGQALYAGRVSNGEVTYLYRYSGTSALSASSVSDPVAMGDED